MYVMSSLPPSQQSLAGGIFNTLAKLCQNIGLGITTAIYVSMENKRPALSAIEPYLSTYWLSAGFGGLGVLLVFFLKIGTQGGANSKVPGTGKDERSGLSTPEIGQDGGMEKDGNSGEKL